MNKTVVRISDYFESAKRLIGWRRSPKTRAVRGGCYQNGLEFACLEARNLLSAVRIANWNVNNNPDTPIERSEFSLVVESIGQESIFGNARALDILVLAETDTDSAQQLDDVFDTLYNTSAYEIFTSNADQGGDRTGFIYNTDTVSLLSTIEIPNPTVTHNSLRAQFRPIGATALEDFYVYAVHLKSGTGSANANIRAVEASVIRSDADLLGPGASIIYAGDFNLAGSSEAAWSTIVAAGNGSATDAANAPGQWTDNPAFRSVHSHSTTQLDGRFDLQFISDELRDGFGLDYVDGSVHVFGNNGTHDFDGMITSGTGATPDVLNALLASSDHLPVVADYEIVSSSPGVVIIQTGGSTNVTEGGSSDSYDVFLRTIPISDVVITVVPDSQIDVGAGPGVSADLSFNTSNALTPQTIFVSAFDDEILEGPHAGLIEHFVFSNDLDYDGVPVDSIDVVVADNDATLNQPFLSEIYVNPPGVDDNREYVEIVAPFLEPLTDIWLLEVEGDGSNAGIIDNAQDLSSLATGSNGLLLLGDDYLTSGHPWTDELNAETTIGNLANSAIENGSITFLLVANFSASTGTDLDTDNDGILDLAPWDNLWDSVGWNDGGALDQTYAAAVLSQSGVPDAATRLPGNFDSNSATAWYNGDIDGAGTSTLYGGNVSSNIPDGAVITPGAVNFGPFVGEVASSSWTLIRGVLESGSTGDLEFSDDAYLKVHSSVTRSVLDPAVWIEFNGISPALNPDSLEFRLETNASTFNLVQTIDVFDFDLQQFETVDVSAATFTDSVVEVVLNGDVSRFVESTTGELRARALWSPVGPVIGFPWRISIDQATWGINTNGTSNLLAGGDDIVERHENSNPPALVLISPDAEKIADNNQRKQLKADRPAKQRTLLPRLSGGFGLFQNEGIDRFISESDFESAVDDIFFFENDVLDGTIIERILV